MSRARRFRACLALALVCLPAGPVSAWQRRAVLAGPAATGVVLLTARFADDRYWPVDVLTFAVAPVGPAAVRILAESCPADPCVFSDEVLPGTVDVGDAAVHVDVTHPRLGRIVLTGTYPDQRVGVSTTCTVSTTMGSTWTAATQSADYRRVAWTGQVGQWRVRPFAEVCSVAHLAGVVTVS